MKTRTFIPMADPICNWIDASELTWLMSISEKYSFPASVSNAFSFLIYTFVFFSVFISSFEEVF